MGKPEIDKVDVDTTDLTQEEGTPAARADVLFYRGQKINLEFEFLKLFRFKIETETGDHLTARLAQSLLMVAVTAVLTGGLAGGLVWLSSAPAWMTAAAGMGTMIMVGAIALWWISVQSRKAADTTEIDTPPTCT